MPGTVRRAARGRRAGDLVAALVVAFALLALGAGVAQAATSPWRAAQDTRSGLREAGVELLIGDRAAAVREVRSSRSAYDVGLAAPIRAADPSAGRAARGALRQAAAAARAGDELALAAARGAARAAVLRGAYAVTTNAAGAGDARTAQAWLLLREFRTATRFTRPGADGTLAVRRLARGRATPAQARTAVVKDELDAYQSRLRELLDDAGQAAQRGFGPRQAEAAAQAAGYWQILAARYRQDRGATESTTAATAFDRLAASAAGGDRTVFTAALTTAQRAVDGFTAAPFTNAEAGRRAQQLLRFLALVPVEYDRGVSGERVTLDFEIQEAVAFRTGAAAAFTDLAALLARRDARRTVAVQQDLQTLRTMVEGAARDPRGVTPAGQVERVATRAQDRLERIMPKPWTEPTAESDYDLIALTLDQLEAAVGAGDYDKAEQARLEAYAFFEFGPERRLAAFEPGLATDVEGLIWFGARDQPGLARLIARHAPRREIRENRLALDAGLEDSAAVLGDAANRATVVTNAAILVFREGLEAVMILAAITASFIGARRKLRRPVLIGAGLGLLASVVTWVLAQTLLQSLTQYGEKLEAVVGLVAIAVLLLVTNWFFHKVYWSEWIGRFHRQRKRIERISGTGFISAQALGLALLGLSSVYREGFETVLFLQSLQLSAGTATVLEGTGLGLLLTFGVAVAILGLGHKLPYKKMLVLTGVLIGVVLVVMVGQTARTMQGTGWLPITSLDVQPPYWLGLWFGVFPTVETLAAQGAAAVFVIGSYFLAQEIQVKRRRRRVRREAAAPQAPAGPARIAGADAQVEERRSPSPR